MPPVGISVQNRQRKVRFDLEWLRHFARNAVVECVRHAAPETPLLQLAAVEVSIVSDAAIARIHWQFMQIAGATDVITFEHGEIIISGETAINYATEYSQKLEEELALYIIHGLLHLGGFDDVKSSDAKKMRSLQNRILKRLTADILH